MNFYRCEAFTENRPCLKPAEFEGTMGHLLCGICKEAIRNQNPDINLREKVLGYEGQKQILDAISLEGQTGEPQLTGERKL